MRQIVAFFWAIANPFLMKPAAGFPNFSFGGTAGSALESATRADVY
jgi:hypothetical protein